MISEHIRALAGSPTGTFLQLAKEREAKGHDIIHLEIGQPDFQPLPEIIDATIKAIQEGKTSYTVSSGIPELRREISHQYKEDYGVEINPSNQIMVTAGAKLGVLASIYSILNTDEILLVSEPYWVSYPAMTQLARGKCVTIPMDEGFELNQEKILEVCQNNKVKAMIINSPCNPSGHVINPSELKFIKDLVEDKNITIISDEIYNDYYYVPASIKTLLTEFSNWEDNVIVINGFSKTFSMTGYRLGFTISHETIAKGILKIIQNSTTCPANFCQWAGIAAIRNRNKARQLINSLFPKRRELLRSEVSKTNGMSISTIDGAFYGFIKYNFTNKPSELVARDLLIYADVCVIPGTAFGSSAEGYLRFAFSRSEEEIKTAFSRIRDYISSL